VELFQKLLPRHLELIYLINHYFLEQAKDAFPASDRERRLKNISLIEEGSPKLIRIANLCIVACNKIVFCSTLQMKIALEQLFPDFQAFIPQRFVLIQNGVNPRRWIHNTNRQLSQIITQEVGDESEWLLNLDAIRSLKVYEEDLTFFDSVLEARASNKKRLIQWLQKKVPGVDISPDAIFDIMVKRIDEGKRQFLNVLYVIFRYFRLKRLGTEGVVPRVVMMGGKTTPGNQKAKAIIQLIFRVGELINTDPTTKDYLQLLFIPNYNASKE